MSHGTYILLSGGVGGSRFAAGMAGCLAPERLKIVVNTGDDFDHLGLRICPDLDTVTYMLAGLVDEARGWGRRDESWMAMQVIQRLGGETWFSLGDCDLALHLYRTQRLQECGLADVTAEIGSRLGVRHVIWPMTDEQVATVVETVEGDLPFQEYFVRRRCEPVAVGCRYEGASEATPARDLLEALAAPNLAGVIIAPSNPIFSIGPILALPGVKDAIGACKAPVIAVSPLVAGRAVKGPVVKLIAELGYPSGVEGVAACYRGLTDGFVIDERDDHDAGSRLGLRVLRTNTLMTDGSRRCQLAAECLRFLKTLHRA